MVFLIWLMGFFCLSQQLLLALAADGVRDGKGSMLGFLHPHEPSAPSANHFDEHGFTSFLRA
jgi:hypothetical protein